ncbi:MAG: hypothetical protein ACI9YB_001447, partial [Halioglobus sp.]
MSTKVNTKYADNINKEREAKRIRERKRRQGKKRQTTI